MRKDPTLNLIDYLENNAGKIPEKIEVEREGIEEKIISAIQPDDSEEREIMPDVNYQKEIITINKEAVPREVLIVRHQGYEAKYLINQSGGLDRVSLSPPLMKANRYIVKQVEQKAKDALIKLEDEKSKRKIPREAGYH